MDENPSAPRLQLGADGVYSWRSPLDRTARRGVIRITMGSIGATCLVFVIMALSMHATRGVMAATLLSILAVLAVSGFICFLFDRLSAGGTQPYEMGPEYLRFVGTGRSNAVFCYEQIRRVTIDESRDLIQVKGTVVSAPFFVPHEDFGFVQSYVLQRLGPDADVVYK